MCIYIYIERERCIHLSLSLSLPKGVEAERLPAQPLRLAGLRRGPARELGSGRMGVSTDGVTAILCFFDRGTFGVLPWTYFGLRRGPAREPQSRTSKGVGRQDMGPFARNSCVSTVCSRPFLRGAPMFQQYALLSYALTCALQQRIYICVIYIYIYIYIYVLRMR